MSNLKYEFSSNWKENDKNDFSEKIDIAQNELINIIGNQATDEIWKIKKIESEESVNALALIPERVIQISPNCPMFSLAHELYHVFHSNYDFGIDIFEEGIAVAASTIVCQKLVVQTALEFEDFKFIGYNSKGFASDPVVPLEQFLPLLPMRYSELGKFWLNAEKKHTGVLKAMTEYQFEYKKFEPPKRLLKQFNVLEGIDPQLCTDLLDLWQIDKRPLLIEKLNEQREVYFMPFIDNINKSLYLISFEKYLSKIKSGNWEDVGILEKGFPMRLKLRIERKTGEGPVNEPDIQITENGYLAFTLSNTKDLIGESANGYQLKLIDHESGQIIANTDFVI